MKKIKKYLDDNLVFQVKNEKINVRLNNRIVFTLTVEELQSLKIAVIRIDDKMEIFKNF
jgi:hypothetical protein